ncbi:MAG: hypothetical protein K1X89_07000 [Myxococcaceae bacterium]|nr:hypothetical protein [Myxococcaceae bacterium]
MLRTALTVALSLLPLATHAQTVGQGRVNDEFDRPALLGAGWVASTGPGCSIATSSAAAHRGDGGLAVIDTNGAMGSGQHAFVEVSGLGASPTYRVRLWTRRLTPATQENVHVAVLNTSLNTYFFEATYGGSTVLAGHDRSDAYSFAQDSASYSDGGWHLLEGVVTGLDSTSGARELYFDGQRLLRQTGIDFSGATLDQVKVGKSVSINERFQGEVDVDDVRVDPNPQASTVVLSSDAGPLSTADCARVTVGLVDSETSSPAPAPYDVDVVVQGTQDATLYPVPDCQGTASRVWTIAKGATAVTGSVRFDDRGTAQVTARHVDFLSGSPALFSVQRPGGGGGGSASAGGGSVGGGGQGTRPFEVACGCGSAPTFGVLAAAVALVRRRRR